MGHGFRDILGKNPCNPRGDQGPGRLCARSASDVPRRAIRHRQHPADQQRWQLDHQPAVGRPGCAVGGARVFGVLRCRNLESLSQRCSYSGLSPSASNCPLHSVGGSRSQGRRPSTAALIGHLAPGFWSLQAFTFFRHDFLRFVSASKNFVPGGWVLGRRMPRTCTEIPPFGPR